MFKKILIAVIIVLATVASVQATCLQDQYGNQYDFTIDSTHTYLYGVANMAQCGGATWYLTGSYVSSGGAQIELTPANPLGDSDPLCVPTYKIKGKYPSAAWYYTWGYGGQEFRLGACTAVLSTPDNAESGGALK